MGSVAILMVAVVFWAHEAAFANEAKFRPSNKPAKGRYIVVLEKGPVAVDVAARELVRAYGGEVDHLFRGAPWEGFSLKNLPEAAALALSQNPRVRLVEEDALGTLQQAAPQHAQWGLDRTNQAGLPLDFVTSAGCEGAASSWIYIMDTGVNDPNGTEFLRASNSTSRLIDGYKDPSFPSYRDGYVSNNHPGHGTPVASIAGGNNWGVAYTANIVNVKVWRDDGYGTASMALAAIRNFINPHAVSGPKIVNISAIYSSSSLAEEILNSISTYNVTYVVSAFGGGVDSCNGYVPERYGKTNGLITVGSTYLVPNAQGTPYMIDARSNHPNGDTVTTKPWSSNQGPCVDIYAPGTGVGAMLADGSNGQFTGTSAAAPYVAGAVARHHSNYYSSYGVVRTAADAEITLKGWATAGVITDLTASSNNLLLNRFYLRCRAIR